MGCCFCAIGRDGIFWLCCSCVAVVGCRFLGGCFGGW